MHRKDQRRARARLGDLLDAHADRDARAGDAAVLLWERNAEDSVFREQLLDVLWILARLVDLGRARGNAILDQLADRVPDGDLLRGELEVHLGWIIRPSTNRARSRSAAPGWNPRRSGALSRRGRAVRMGFRRGRRLRRRSAMRRAQPASQCPCSGASPSMPAA